MGTKGPINVPMTTQEMFALMNAIGHANMSPAMKSGDQMIVTWVAQRLERLLNEHADETDRALSRVEF